MKRLGMLIASFALVSACGTSHPPRERHDSGGRDGGRSDGGPRSDAAPGSDGGSALDGGPAPDARMYCGTIAGIRCPAGTYCDYPDGSFCGGDDSGGVCVPIGPRECDLIYAPVCGCDNETYGNACAAAAAGVDVQHSGECEMPAPLTCTNETPCVGGVCIGMGCTGPAWECVFTGMACTDDLAAYCGCDGLTFYDSSTCPTQPFADRGACDPAGGG